MASNCIVSNGIQIGCADVSGGISKFYVASFSGSTTATVDTLNNITGITSSPQFYEFEVRQESASFTQTQTQTIEIGNNLYEQTVSVTLPKYDSTNRNLLALLAKAPLHIIVKDNNGQYVLVGDPINSGAYLTTSTSGFGKMYNELNGVTYTFVAKSSAPARLVSSSVITALAPTI